MSGKATATLDGKVIAEASTWETVEGNIYFPPEYVLPTFNGVPWSQHPCSSCTELADMSIAYSSVDQSVLKKSSLQTGCPWKGMASYYTLNVNGKEYKDSAWYYPEPKEKAMNIKDHVAFCESFVEFAKLYWRYDADLRVDKNKVQIKSS